MELLDLGILGPLNCPDVFAFHPLLRATACLVGQVDTTRGCRWNWLFRLQEAKVLEMIMDLPSQFGNEQSVC